MGGWVWAFYIPHDIPKKNHGTCCMVGQGGPPCCILYNILTPIVLVCGKYTYKTILKTTLYMNIYIYVCVYVTVVNGVYKTPYN